LSRVAATRWRLSANFIPILALFLVTGGALFTGALYAPVAVFAFILAGWVVSLCLHEGAHAWVAYLGGDKSVKEKGYLSFDPLSYADPMMSFGLPILFLLLGGIGLPGGGVYINRVVLKNKHWDAMVPLAGPAANLFFLVVLSLPFMMGVPEAVGNSTFWSAVAFLASLQAMAVVLNILPIPGLDGFGVIRPYLPYDMQAQADRISRFVGFGLLFLFMNRSFSSAIWNAVSKITGGLGIDPFYIGSGYMLFHFWK